MEAFEASSGGTVKSFDSTESISRKVSDTPSSTKPTTATFEWVTHNDPSARRRARAHVTRGFRREKAEAARLAKAQLGAQDKSKGLSLEKGETVMEVSEFAWHDDSDTRDDITGNKELFRSYKEVSKISDAFVPLLLHAIGSGNTDPFHALPVQLDASGHFILKHFLFGLKPISYNVDSTSDFGPVRNLCFKLALAEPSGFHTVCAVGANDMAVLQGKDDCFLALKHRGQSITLLNKRLTVGDTSDNTLTGIALLAGHELLLGVPRNFMFHMKGLATILEGRGGIEALRVSNPDLYSWIQWIDYSGGCNFMTRRRFAPTPSQVLLKIDTTGCPIALLRKLPAQYDVFECIIQSCLRCEALINISNETGNSDKNLQTLSMFVNQVDSELVQLVATTNIKGNKGRRWFISQFHYIFSVMAGAVFVKLGLTKGEALFDRLEEFVTGDARSLLAQYGGLCRMMINGNKFTDTLLHSRINQILDTSGPWDWEEWERVRNKLMDFFLSDPICEGHWQRLWRIRTGYTT